MKRLLFGLAFLASVSSFANEVTSNECRVSATLEPASVSEVYEQKPGTNEYIKVTRLIAQKGYGYIAEVYVDDVKVNDGGHVFKCDQLQGVAVVYGLLNYEYRYNDHSKYILQIYVNEKLVRRIVGGTVKRDGPIATAGVVEKVFSEIKN